MMIFFNFLPKFCFEQLDRSSSLIGDMSEVFSKFTKFPVAIVNGGRSKASFRISRDHMINESRVSVGAIPSSKITQVIVRATERNYKNIFVLQIGASLCYKLGQLHYHKLGQVLLQIEAASTNQGNLITKQGNYYKLAQNVLRIGACIINQGNYYKFVHNNDRPNTKQ